MKFQPDISTLSSLIYLDLAKGGILHLAMNLEKDHCHNVSANKTISKFSKTFNEIGENYL